MSDINNRFSMALIALTSDNKFIDIYNWHATPHIYVNAVINVAKATPLIVPSLENEAAIGAVLDRVDGVLLTGSRSNLYPPLYGGVAREADEPFDQARDATSMRLAQMSLERGIPLLAICRGLQDLNVAFGGSLATEIQEEEGRRDHRAADSKDNDVRFAIDHQIHIVAGTLLADILGNDDVAVNSLHRQAISRLAQGLTVNAKTDDGTIEAVSVDMAGNFALGVQWHPEYWATSDAPSAKIFKAFGVAARGYESRRTTIARAAE